MLLVGAALRLLLTRHSIHLGASWHHSNINIYASPFSPSRKNQTKAQRRQEAVEADGKKDEESEESAGVDCSLDAGRESLEIVLTCILCLLGTFLLRSAFCYLIKHVLNRKINDGLLFPAWEGM